MVALTPRMMPNKHRSAIRRYPSANKPKTASQKKTCPPKFAHLNKLPTVSTHARPHPRNPPPPHKRGSVRSQALIPYAYLHSQERNRDGTFQRGTASRNAQRRACFPQRPRMARWLTRLATAPHTAEIAPTASTSRHTTSKSKRSSTRRPDWRWWLARFLLCRTYHS